MLIMTIDAALNEIWHVEKQRPIPQRLLVYWAIITLGPILTGASLWASSILVRESLGYFGTVPIGLGLMLSIVPLFAESLGFTALCVVVPTRLNLWRGAVW